MLSARDIREFNGFLRQATDRQVQGIYEKEARAGRDDYAELAIAEADRRGIVLDLVDDDGNDDSDDDHSTMLRFPRWRVDVTVGDRLVKTFHETATTPQAAIGKAKHKMRGAVSSAGAFKFKAHRIDNGGAEEPRHATRKTPAQLDREIAEALTHKSGSRSHSTRQGRGSYPFDLVPGDVVMRRDIKGRKKYRVSHLGTSGNFVQVYTREVGSGGGGIVTFDRSQLRLVD